MEPATYLMLLVGQ